MLLDLQQYLLDLVESWTAFMTGGTVAAAVLLIERLRRPLSPKVFMLVFLVFGFGAASFVTWQKEHAARSVAEQNTRKGRSAETVRQLQQYYADAVAYYAQATDAASDEEFKQTEKEADEWATRMGHWVILNMGYGAYSRLLQDTQQAAAKKNFKPKRADLLVMLSIIRDNLGTFVENPAWDKP